MQLFRPPQLHHVARATIVASLLYASLAWWGFTSAEDRSRLERLVGRLGRGGYMPDEFPTVESLAGVAENKLFVSIAGNPHHVLRRYYHEKKSSGHNLRTRTHNFLLPEKDDRNFVSQSIYMYMYAEL